MPTAQRATNATELSIKLESSAPHTPTDCSDETTKYGRKDATDGFESMQPHALGWPIMEINRKLGLTLSVASAAAPCSKSSAAVLLWPFLAAQKRGVELSCTAQTATFTPGSLGRQAFNAGSGGRQKRNGGMPAAQRPMHATELSVQLASSAPHTPTGGSYETAKHGGKDATDGFQTTQPHALGWPIREKNQKLGLTLSVASAAAPCSKSSAAVLFWPFSAAQKRGV